MQADVASAYSLLKTFGPIIGTGIIGYILKIFYDRKYGKRVILFHVIDKPATFSVIPPKVCFQNLRIFNKGNIPANNVRISLKGEYFASEDNIFKVITQDKVYEDRSADTITIGLEKLRPNEELHIVFKTFDILKDDFIASIKSDEVVSKASTGEAKSSVSETIAGILFLLFIAAIGAGIGIVIYKAGFERDPTVPPAPPSATELNPQSNPLSVTFILSRNVYHKGDKIEAICQVVNRSGEAAKGVYTNLEIPGFDLDYDLAYKKIGYMKPNEMITTRHIVPITKDIHGDKYKAKVSVVGYGLEKTHLTEAFMYFEVR